MVFVSVLWSQLCSHSESVLNVLLSVAEFISKKVKCYSPGGNVQLIEKYSPLGVGTTVLLHKKFYLEYLCILKAGERGSSHVIEQIGSLSTRPESPSVSWLLVCH